MVPSRLLGACRTRESLLHRVLSAQVAPAGARVIGFQRSRCQLPPAIINGLPIKLQAWRTAARSAKFCTFRHHIRALGSAEKASGRPLVPPVAIRPSASKRARPAPRPPSPRLLLFASVCAVVKGERWASQEGNLPRPPAPLLRARLRKGKGLRAGHRAALRRIMRGGRGCSDAEDFTCPPRPRTPR